MAENGLVTTLLVNAHDVDGADDAAACGRKGGPDGANGPPDQQLPYAISRTARPAAAAASSWIPQDHHPCTIDRTTMGEFLEEYGAQGGLPPLFPRPLVITASKSPILGKTQDDDDGSNSSNSNNNDHASLPGRNQQFRDLTQPDTILQFFPPNFTVTLSSSNSFSEHRRTVPLAQYLDEVASGPTRPDQKSNETWYLFGETYSDEWRRLLDRYELPPCQACRDRHPDKVALSFGIGNSGSGVQWHVHGAGFSEAVHGRKHWILSQDRPPFHPDQTSYNWMYHNYSRMSVDERPLECTLFPGDLVYFPDMWWHATINIDPYTAFVSTFTQEHLFVKRIGYALES